MAKRNVILMTGTPVTTPEDVFGYTKFVDPAAYPTFSSFSIVMLKVAIYLTV